MYEGRLVRLRAFDNSDLMRCLSFSNDYGIMRGASGAILYPSTVDDEARAMAGSTSYTSGEYQFAIETLGDGRFIGKCGFTKVNWRNRLGEIALWDFNHTNPFIMVYCSRNQQFNVHIQE